jgi:glycine cleavage system H protein
VTTPDSNVPDGLYYSPEHEWLRFEDGLVRIGVTDYGQDQLGDVVYVVLPEPGRRLTQGERLAEIESVKVAFELLSPVTGEVASRNEAVLNAPDLVNTDPYGEAWLLQVRPDDAEALRATLLTPEAYRKLLGLA